MIAFSNNIEFIFLEEATVTHKNIKLKPTNNIIFVDGILYRLFKGGDLKTEALMSDLLNKKGLYINDYKISTQYLNNVLQVKSEDIEKSLKVKETKDKF